MLFKEDFIKQCDEILNLLESQMTDEFGNTRLKTAATLNNMMGQKVAKLERDVKHNKANMKSPNISVANSAAKNDDHIRSELADAKYKKKQALNTFRTIRNQTDQNASTINSSYEYEDVNFDDLINEAKEIDMMLDEADDPRIKMAERQKEMIQRREQQLTQKYQKQKMDLQQQKQKLQDTIDYARGMNSNDEPASEEQTTQVQEAVQAGAIPQSTINKNNQVVNQMKQQVSNTANVQKNTANNVENQSVQESSTYLQNLTNNAKYKAPGNGLLIKYNMSLKDNDKIKEASMDYHEGQSVAFSGLSGAIIDYLINGKKSTQYPINYEVANYLKTNSDGELFIKKLSIEIKKIHPNINTIRELKNKIYTIYSRLGGK